jgi:hypothetical protein
LSNDGSLSLRAPGAPGRNAYAELLRDTRGLRREQQQAREAWFAQLVAGKKDETLFELEILLKGVACFANPRNHPGSGRRQTIVSHDFLPHLHHARDGMARIVQLVRALLGDRDRSLVFQRYLETVLPEDMARTKLLHATMSQETPEASLVLLRHGFTNLIEVIGGLLRLPKVNFRLFYSSLATAMREIAESAFFNPLSALEFRPEFDRIYSTQVLELISGVSGEHAHRLVALTFLAIFRMLRYLRLIESIAVDHTDRRVAGRAYLVLAVLRSDARALSSYLKSHAGPLLAQSFERDIFHVPSSDVAARYEELYAEGHRLIAIKSALTGLAASLRLEMKRTFEHELPPADAGTAEQDLRVRLRHIAASLRPALQNATLFLGRSLGARLDEASVFDDPSVKRGTSDRLRRDVWMFAQIARAFASKARHADPAEDSWTGGASFAFVREFLSYFRAMGYPLLRAADYPRYDSFMAAMNGLEETDLLDSNRLEAAIQECENFYAFLTRLFEQISKREELAGVAFDRRDAARTLRLYLGD